MRVVGVRMVIGLRRAVEFEFGFGFRFGLRLQFRVEV